MIRSSILLFALAVCSVAQELPVAFQLDFQERSSARDDADYQSGRRALESRQWDRAIRAFEASASHKGANADGALYWRAYAQNRAGRREEALTTIAGLRQAYPSSRWLNDAQALEIEVRGEAGNPVSPGNESNEDLKIIALNSLMQAEPNQALPILEKLLRSNNSPAVKEKALFVLTQNPAPEARKILGDTARGNANPDLQLKAIQYMGMMGSDDSRRDLETIYKSSSDKRIKSAILKSFMVSGSRDFLLSAAKSEKDPELQREAIRQLAMTGGQEELWQIYQSGGSAENKEEILKSMFLTGNATRLAEIARTEKDPRLRIAAIKSMGLMGGNGRGDVLVSVYESDQNVEVRKAILNSLFLQQNGKALVDLARSEKNPEMKQEIVKKMALVRSKETNDYMMEILK